MAMTTGCLDPGDCAFPKCDCQFKARCISGEPVDEAEHFYTCAACGQAVDMRDLGQVFHHEDPGHEPMRADA